MKLTMKSFLFFLAIAIILFLSACGVAKPEEDTFIIESDNNKPTEQLQQEQITIGLVMKTLTNPFFIEMENGARQAADKYNVELIVKTGAQETSIDQQIDIVEELIASEVDAIVIAPGSSTELIPVLQKAQSSGIIVVNIDNKLDRKLSEEMGLMNVPFISVDNEEGAYLSAQRISEMVTAHTEAIIIEGIQTAKNSQDRKAGAERAFEENPNISIVASETANWKIDEAYTLTEILFKAHPDVKIVFCANDMMALGVIQYMSDHNKDDILIAAYDALDEAKNMIREGKLVVTIDQQAAKQGYLGVEYAVKMIDGEEMPLETMVNVLVIDKKALE